MVYTHLSDPVYIINIPRHALHVAITYNKYLYSLHLYNTLYTNAIAVQDLN